jgi:L-arabinose isomerase
LSGACSRSRSGLTDAFADFAEIAGVELLVIDAETRVRELAKELHRNQAYFQLARGL